MPKILKISIFDIFNSHGPWTLKFFKLMDYGLGGLIALFLPQKEQGVLLNRPVRRILIIRPGGMGDAVFLLPILKNLRLQNISIDILGESRNMEVFTSQGYSVYPYNQFHSLRQVFRNSYDVVIDTEQWHYFSAIVSYFVKAKYRIGFATRALRAKLFNRPVAYVEGDYELDNFSRLFEGILPSSSKDIHYSFDISETLQEWASKQIPEKSVTVFLGASIILRRLSKVHLLEIIKDILSKGQCPVLLGGRDVAEVGHQIMNETQGSINFVGKTSLIQSAALIQRSEQFVGPDSGLMHVACAVGTPVVAVFGPGNLSKWRPQGHQHKIVTENASCAPCTRFGYTIPTCRGSYHCMKNIKYLSGRD